MSSFTRIPMEPRPETDWCVYVLRRVDYDGENSAPPQSKWHYTGITNRLMQRVGVHNTGGCKTTRGHEWFILLTITNLRREEAGLIERFLKTGNTVTKRMQLLKLTTTFGDEELTALEFYTYFRDQYKRWVNARMLRIKHRTETQEQRARGFID